MFAFIVRAADFSDRQVFTAFCSCQHCKAHRAESRQPNESLLLHHHWDWLQPESVTPLKVFMKKSEQPKCDVSWPTSPSSLVKKYTSRVFREDNWEIFALHANHLLKKHPDSFTVTLQSRTAHALHQCPNTATDSTWPNIFQFSSVF